MISKNTHEHVRYGFVPDFNLVKLFNGNKFKIFDYIYMNKIDYLPYLFFTPSSFWKSFHSCHSLDDINLAIFKLPEESIMERLNDFVKFGECIFC